MKSKITWSASVANTISTPKSIKLTTGQEFVDAVDTNVNNDSWVDWNEDFIKNLPAEFINYNIWDEWMYPVILQAAALGQIKTVKAMVENTNLDFSAKINKLETTASFIGSSICRNFNAILDATKFWWEVTPELKTACINQFEILTILMESNNITDDVKKDMAIGFAFLNRLGLEDKKDNLPDDLKLVYENIEKLANTKLQEFWIDTITKHN